MNPGQEIQVEPRNRHDGIVVVFLDRNKDIGDFVPKENKTSIISGFDGAEEGRGGRE